MAERIAEQTTIGAVQLYVADLERSLRFYQQVLGFRVLEQAAEQAGDLRPGAQIVLGTVGGASRLLVLNERPGARRVRGVTGLYHFAVLLPDRRALARLIVHMAQSGFEVQGASDHGVSEALYLADPDGNGIELYRDRRRSEWPADDLGRLQMVTDALDIDDMLGELKGGMEAWQGLPAGTVIGHMHLHVSDLLEAERFYVKLMGFEIMQRYGNAALFVSAGGYHHHIGLNTWAGVGAPPPPPDAAGLRWFELVFPDPVVRDAVLARLEAAGVQAQPEDGGMLVRDPSQNGILLRG